MAEGVRIPDVPPASGTPAHVLVVDSAGSGPVRSAWAGFVALVTAGVSSGLAALQATLTASIAAVASSVSSLTSTVNTHTSQIATLFAGQGSGLIAKDTWTALAAVTPAANTTGMVLAGDTGTHTDPVVGGTVANSGRYSYSTSPAGWKRIGGLDAQGAQTLGTATGTATAYVAADPSSPAAYQAGMSWYFTPHVHSGVNPTLNVSALGAKSLVDRGGVALPTAGLLLGYRYLVSYDGTNIRVLTDPLELERVVAYSESATHPGLSLETGDGRPFIAMLGGQVFVSDKETAGRDARNLAYARAVAGRFVTEVPGLYWNYNFIAGYPAQSFDMGAEAWPAMWSSASPADFYTSGQLSVAMQQIKFMGDDIRPSLAGGNIEDFVAVGGLAFTAAEGKVRDGDTILSAAAVAALTPGYVAQGETPLLSAAYSLSRLYLQSKGVTADPDRLLVPAVLGTGGTPLENLAKVPGDGVYRYGRFEGALAALETLATGLSKTYGCVAFVTNQGQSDQNVSVANSSQDRAAHYTQLKTLDDNMCADVLAEFPHQQEKPALFIVQPGGNGYIRDIDGNLNPDSHVCMAMQQYARDNKGRVFIVGPDYHTTDKASHPDANGARWLGVKIGLVMHRVLVQRRGWEPCWIIGTELHPGRRVLDIHIHAPEPPIVLNGPYREDFFYFTGDFPRWGFSPFDARGWIGATPLQVHSTIVRLFLDRDPVGVAGVFYAGQQHGGYGLISDSDRTDPLAKYLYKSGSGQYATADIAALKNDPYKVRNWLLNGCYPMNWEASK